MTATVVILLSDKRSGSTWFERELCKHRDVRHIHFTPHTYNETHYWVKAACILPTATEDFSGGVRPDAYGSSTAARKSLVKTIQGNVPDFVVPDDAEKLVFEGWNVLCKQFAHPVFFEKSPQHPHHWAALELLVSWIRTTDYQVRVIGLVRNPMSVMYSALQLFQTDPQNRQFGWAHANRNILKFGELLNDEQFYFVRYEDVVRQPELEFRKLCDFIGIDYESAVGQSVHDSSLNKWRDDVTYTLQLDESVSALAREFGYSEQDLYNPPKPEPWILDKIQRELVLKFKRGKSKVYNFIKRLLI